MSMALKEYPPLIKKRKSLWEEIWRKKALYIMVLPGLLLFLVNNYLPMFGTIIAFKNVNFVDGILGSPWVGLKNFEYLFASPQAFQITRNTILYNAVFIFLNLLIGVSFAIALNEILNRRLAKFYQATLFFPGLLSMVVISYLVYSLLSLDYGFFNKVLFPALGWEPINWYGETKYWPFILTIVNSWINMGYYSVLFLGSVVSVDPEYYEAAVVDGATKWQQITKITLPMLTPLIIIMLLLQVGRIFFGNFGLFFQVPRPNSGILFPVTQVIDTYVYRALVSTGDIGMAAAAGLYQSVVGFVLVFTVNMAVRRIDKDRAIF